jgi:hypothetical protein
MEFQILNHRSLRTKFGKFTSVIVSDEDSDLVRGFNWYLTNQGYVRGRPKRCHSNKQVLLHRLILGLCDGDRRMADHINLIQTDCRRQNLRIASRALNTHNTKAHNQTGFKGVTKTRYGYRVTIGHNCKTINLGLFSDPISAAHAYDAKARELYERPRLNFPKDGTHELSAKPT